MKKSTKKLLVYGGAAVAVEMYTGYFSGLWKYIFVPGANAPPPMDKAFSGFSGTYCIAPKSPAPR